MPVYEVSLIQYVTVPQRRTLLVEAGSGVEAEEEALYYSEFEPDRLLDNSRFGDNGDTGWVTSEEEGWVSSGVSVLFVEERTDFVEEAPNGS